MADLTDFTDILTRPELAGVMSLDSIVRLCELIYRLKEDIAAVQHSAFMGAPELLPVNVHNFLLACFSITDEEMKLAWSLLRNIAWTFWDSFDKHQQEQHAQALVNLFLEHGLAHDVYFYSLRPPVRTCHDAACTHTSRRWDGGLREAELVEPLSRTVTVFTRNLGAVPARATSLYCRRCHTRYHHNYYVHDQATMRTYYHGVPPILQIADHFFVSRDICEMFVNLMLISWTSATNCAQFYNCSVGITPSHSLLPIQWSVALSMTTEHAWDAFYLYCLLEDHAEQQSVLSLKHNAPSQAERLRPALEARNRHMAGPGQEEWNHACDLCCWVYEDKEGSPWALRSAVTDGVTLGHPCCAVHDCKEPLQSKKGARYCTIHDHQEHKCAVIACQRGICAGHKTCDDPAHRSLEDYLRLENRAMFQLKGRLERLKTSQKSDTAVVSGITLERLQDDSTAQFAMPQSATNHVSTTSSNPGEDTESSNELLDEIDIEIPPAESIECEGKNEHGNRKLRAQFGRRRTHNEELCVASCGVILGRATFFGSEAINGVLQFWMQLFPTRTSLPNVLWHDQNCRLFLLLKNSPETTQKFFEGCALPVDVFHFKCKHKETDIVCGTHCNPYIWPELRTPDGKWRFNSSAAEQTNVWFGKYQAIVREMQVDRFNFFLDEMIKRRNRRTVADLQKKGKHPYRIPRDVLLHDVL